MIILVYIITLYPGPFPIAHDLARVMVSEAALECALLYTPIITHFVTLYRRYRG